MGFEPTRAEHNGLAVHRLNHSATSSFLLYFTFTTVTIFSQKRLHCSKVKIIRFSRPFSSSLHSIFRKCAFNFVPDTLECANARFNFVSGRSILKHCHSISCFVTHFRQLQFNSSVTVAEHETTKTISSIGIHFRQSFNQIRLPGAEAQ